MRTMQSIVDLIGRPLTDAHLQELVRVDRLLYSRDENLEEGVPLSEYLCGAECGYELATGGTERITTAFFHLIPHSEGLPFRGSLVRNLSASPTRREVLALFGSPDRSGRPNFDPPVDPAFHTGPWDRFDGDEVCYHFTYEGADERVALITVMDRSEAP